MDESVEIERREFKYLATMDQVPRIRDALRGICTLDRHAGPNGRYTIRSLYLDTLDQRLYMANVREDFDRYKVRVRTYPDRPKAPVFLEVKRRTGDIIRKVRVAIDPGRWPSVLDALPAENDHRSAAFADLVRLHAFEPAVMIEYDREAWVSNLDDYGRVTFDFAIGAMPADGWSLAPTSSGRMPLDTQFRTTTFAPVVVVEMKFSGPAPVWMTRLVQRVELTRYAFSKYGSGVVELGWPVGYRLPVAMGA